MIRSTTYNMFFAANLAVEQKLFFDRYITTQLDI